MVVLHVLHLYSNSALLFFSVLCLSEMLIPIPVSISGSRHSEIEVGDLQHEIQELKQKHQKLINEYISLQSNRQKGSSEEGVSFRTDTPTSPILIDALQSEVTRLMGENLTLREQVEDTTTPLKTRRSIRG